MRNLIPAILLRHIHGNDLDKSALSVAKVNLWLEGIKSAPSDFRYTELGESNRILPYLEMNLIFGNAVVGLDDDTVIHYMKTNKKQELQQFFNVINKFSLEDIISIDETSVSTSLTHKYCRAYLGDRCVKKTTNNEVFKKYSLVVAINNKKCISSELYQNGSVNADRFNEFLQNICNKIKGKLIVLDNGQIHKKESTKQIIKDSGNFLVYTCPYHPRLNSIEQFFNQMKHFIKLDKPNTFIALDNSITSSITKIKPIHYENYFIYAYNKSYYKNKQNGKKYTKRRTLKVYKD